MMLRLLSNFLRNKRGFHRSIALFFVLFTFLDIMSPQLCGEELTEYSTSPRVSALDSRLNNIDNSIITLTHSLPKQDQDINDSDNDCCFCCCTHWLPIKTFSMVISYIILPTNEPAKIPLPDAPPQNTYPPPRFS